MCYRQYRNQTGNHQCIRRQPTCIQMAMLFLSLRIHPRFLHVVRKFLHVDQSGRCFHISLLTLFPLNSCWFKEKEERKNVKYVSYLNLVFQIKKKNFFKKKYYLTRVCSWINFELTANDSTDMLHFHYLIN